MMPLWTTATRSVAIGWAFFSFGLPCVAQRVWPMPIVPRTGSRSRRGGGVRKFAFGAAPLDPAIDQGRDARRIIAAVFEPPEALDQLWRDRFLGNDPNDAAHQPFFHRSSHP